MRIYDPRVGKFLSVDPLTKDYPWYTPYQFAGNTPIQAIDLDGQEPYMGMSRAAQGQYGETSQKIVTGTAEGAANAVRGTYNFFRRDAWKASTWKNVGNFLEQGAFSMSSVKVTETPMIDAKVDEFINQVINGDAYTRSKYFSEFGTSLILGIAADKGIGKISSIISGPIVANGIKAIDLALGKNVNLEKFASKTSSISMHKFDDIPGYSEVKEGFENFENAFGYVTEAVVNTNGKILFNLEFVNLQVVGKIKPGTGLYQKIPELGNKSLWEMDYITEWELRTVLDNTKLSSITELKRMGVNVPESSVRELMKPKTP